MCLMNPPPLDSFKDTISFQPLFAATMVMPCCWVVELGCSGAAKYDLVVKIKLFTKVFGLMVQDCSYTKYFPLFMDGA